MKSSLTEKKETEKVNPFANQPKSSIFSGSELFGKKIETKPETEAKKEDVPASTPLFGSSSNKTKSIFGAGIS